MGLPLVAIPLAGRAGALHPGGALQPVAPVRPRGAARHARCRMRPEVNVAVFTDNDFEKVNGVTTTLRRVAAARTRRHPAARLHGVRDCRWTRPTTSRCGRSASPIPFYGEMRMYVPRVLRYLRARARGPHRRRPPDHAGAGGPGGAVRRLATGTADGRQLPHRPGGLHHAAERIGSPRRADARVHAVAVRALPAGARALASTRATLIDGEGEPGQDRPLAPRRGHELFAPVPAVDGAPPALAACRTGVRRCCTSGGVSREKGLALLPPLERRLRAHGSPHRFVIAGQGRWRPNCAG